MVSQLKLGCGCVSASAAQPRRRNRMENRKIASVIFLWLRSIFLISFFLKSMSTMDRI